MAGSVNKVILVGNLGKDPEIRRTQDGRPIANLRIATTETWRDKTSGERREKTEWHSVVVFNEGLCRVAEQYLKKGAKVTSRAATDAQWQGQDGQDRYSTEVVLQGFNSRSPCSTRAAERAPVPACTRKTRRATKFGNGAGAKRGGGSASKGSFDKPVDDEIPF